jgi:DivIVA domain-containing protein
VRDFPRSFRGYKRAAVREHLEQIAAWLSLKGVDDLVRERFNEQDPLGRQLRVQAESDADQIREHARREADRRLDEVRHEAGRLVKAAHQAETHAEQVREDARRDADRRAKEARDEARRLLEAAQQDAEGIRAKARREAEALLANARADTAAERRRPLARLLSRGSPDARNRGRATGPDAPQPDPQD